MEEDEIEEGENDGIDTSSEDGNSDDSDDTSEESDDDEYDDKVIKIPIRDSEEFVVFYTYELPDDVEEVLELLRVCANTRFRFSIWHVFQIFAVCSSLISQRIHHIWIYL